ncbi:acetyl/propionyl/methylcrotonyl-CoA carboxylase subunit alpha [Rhodococcus sp. C26F]
MKKVLIANRGEISVRVSQACRALGLTSVAVCSETEQTALHVRFADEVVVLRSDAAIPYLDVDAVVSAAVSAGADAVHPGYGFLSENGSFAEAVTDAGLTFVGPNRSTIDLLGDKVQARRAAVAAAVPVVPGSDLPAADTATIIRFADRYGWPLVVKASRGGGGRGMRVIRAEAEVESAVTSAIREATSAFGNGEIFIERFIENARHVEVQIAADTHGNVVALGDRDCSVQRRNQKLLEEAPAPHLPAGLRNEIHRAAVRLSRDAGYIGLGTVEFLVAGDEFYFLEVNARIQVEHPVTEAVTGLDLVAEQLRIASGDRLTVSATPEPRGHAIEVRINAEDPARGFLPVAGILDELTVPHRVGLRFDAGYESGDTVSSCYDSMIGKLVITAPTREQVIRRAVSVLADVRVVGLPTTLPADMAVLTAPEFVRGGVGTRWFESVLEPTLSVAATDDRPQLAEGLVEVGGRVIRVPRGVKVDGQQIAPAAKRPRRERVAARAAHDGGAVVSPMAGTILAVHVVAGQEVAAADPIATVEAMKMENVIRSTAAGVVGAVTARVGDVIASGHEVATVVTSTASVNQTAATEVPA